MSQKGFSTLYVVLGILILLGLSGAAYYLVTQKNSPSSPVVQSSPLADSSPVNISTAPSSNETSNIPEGWQTYVNSEFSYSLSHPAEYEVTNNGKSDVSLAKKNTELGAGAMNFIYIGVIPDKFQSDGGEIYNYNTKEANLLLNMRVGETKSIRSNASFPALSDGFIYTRLPDINIGGLDAKTYVSNQPWEFPKGVKEYRFFIEKGDNTYMIGGYIEGQDFPKVYYISEAEFHQIVATLKFK